MFAVEDLEPWPSLPALEDPQDLGVARVVTEDDLVVGIGQPRAGLQQPLDHAGLVVGGDLHADLRLKTRLRPPTTVPEPLWRGAHLGRATQRAAPRLPEQEDEQRGYVVADRVGEEEGAEQDGHDREQKSRAGEVMAAKHELHDPAPDRDHGKRRQEGRPQREQARGPPR